MEINEVFIKVDRYCQRNKLANENDSNMVGEVKLATLDGLDGKTCLRR